MATIAIGDIQIEFDTISHGVLTAIRLPGASVMQSARHASARD